MKDTTKKIAGAQHNTEEMVEAGVEMGLVTSDTPTTKQFSATPIAGDTTRVENLENRLWQLLFFAAIPILGIFVGFGGYLGVQVVEINANIATLMSKAEQTEREFVKVDEQFEKIDEQFEKVDQKFEKVDEQLTDLKVQFTRMDEKVTAMDKKMTVMDERVTVMDKKVTAMDKKVTAMDKKVTVMDGALQKILGILEDKLGVSSPVPEALPRETDIGFDPDRDRPVATPLTDPLSDGIDPYLSQPEATPLQEQADVRPDIQPGQAEQPKPMHNNTGGGIGGPEGIPNTGGGIGGPEGIPSE
ncbi:MAG: hypothetical protein K0U66_05475 [Gammaproteobacteria bacterium]|nr:hypothetical protein [Gammaproteobacteria bacterium]